MGNLLDLYIHAVRRGYLELTIRLAMLLYAQIDMRLHLGIPETTVSILSGTLRMYILGYNSKYDCVTTCQNNLFHNFIIPIQNGTLFFLLFIIP